jgi:tyrosinase
MAIEITRRDLIRGGTALTGLALAGLTGGCESLKQKIANRPVRRNIATLSSTDPIVQSYKDAVAAMKALPSSDPRSWTRQAQIHFDHCPHGNYFFLSWHRAYLFAFEQICRELSGNEDFALPYWHWQKNRSIPSHFWGGASNPLFNGTRDVGPTDMLSDEWVGASVLEGILDEPNFFLFASAKSTAPRGTGGGTGSLEGTPHNRVHGWIRGDMGGYHSPLDPIFWCHHNMVDCMWVNWNIERGHPNTNDPDWTGFTFTGNFFDRNGDPLDIATASTLLMPYLSYRFDDPDKGTEGFITSRDIDRRVLRRFLEEGADVRLRVEESFPIATGVEMVPGRAESQESDVTFERMARTVEATDRRVLLSLDGVSAPPEEDFFVRVFVNLPGASAETPIDDPHYAGSFAFFEDGEASHEGGHDKRFLVDMTDALGELQAAGRVGGGEPVTVQLVLVPSDGEAPARRGLELDRMAIDIADVSVEGGVDIRNQR